MKQNNEQESIGRHNDIVCTLLRRSNCAILMTILQYLQEVGISISCVCWILMRPGRGSNAGTSASC